MKSVEKILNVAKYIVDTYKKISGSPIDEMKLHKLLYFSQRESLALTGKVMFEEYFEGWKYGPVNRTVRMAFTGEDMRVKEYQNISYEAQYIVNNIIQQYGSYEPWKLSMISHNEYSWRQARKGMADNENGSQMIKVEDILEDAKKIRPYDSIYDMYYDEFEDVEDIELEKVEGTI